MTKQEKHLIDIYLDFVKNYKSIKAMALAHDMIIIDLQVLLDSGRALQTKYKRK